MKRYTEQFRASGHTIAALADQAEEAAARHDYVDAGRAIDELVKLSMRLVSVARQAQLAVDVEQVNAVTGVGNVER